MAKLLCVFSTLTCDNRYTDAKYAENGMMVEGESVLVRGGSGVMNDRIVTPRGVHTMVSEAQAELLKRNPVFQLHEKNGFVAIEAVDRPPSETDVENAAAALEGRDGSAPLVPEDFTANGETAPVVNTGKQAKAKRGG